MAEGLERVPGTTFNLLNGVDKYDHDCRPSCKEALGRWVALNPVIFVFLIFHMKPKYS